MNDKVKCGNCHIILDNDINSGSRIPCLKCGSLLRCVEITVTDNAIAHEKLNLKIKTPNFKKVIREEICGEEYQYSRRKWARLERVIDRENNKYYEKVIDLETMEVYHECRENLSDHINHGSAKNGDKVPGNPPKKSL